MPLVKKVEELVNAAMVRAMKAADRKAEAQKKAAAEKAKKDKKAAEKKEAVKAMKVIRRAW